MRAKTINEELDFERGVDPRASMEIGGINFNKKFNELVDEWIASMEKALVGKTITAVMTKFWTERGGISKEGRTQKQTIKLAEIDISMPQSFQGTNMFFRMYLTSDDEQRYRMDLNQKIYIGRSIKEDFQRGMSPRRALEVGGLSFQEGFTKDFKKVLDKWFDLLQTLEGKTISAISVQHGSNEDGKSWVSAKTTHKIKVQKVLEPGIRGAHASESDEGMIVLTQWVVGEDDYAYELDLRKKIYIENES